MLILGEHVSQRKKTLVLRFCLIGLSLVVSFLYGVHHLLWLHDIDWDYKHAIFVTSFRAYDANHYLTQLKEIYEGNYLLSNAFIAEYKNTVRPFWPAFPFYLAVSIGKILHLDVQYLAILMDFTLPPLIFLLAYAFLSAISGRRRIALLGAFILVLMPHISRIYVLLGFGAAFLKVVKTYNLSEFIPSLWHAHAYHNGFSRQINPQLTFIFLQAALLCFLKHLMTSRKRYLGLTILFGILTSYSYVYFSSYLYLFWGIFAITCGILHRSDHIKSTLFALSGTLLFASPFWYSVFKFSETELSQVTLMTKTHALILTPQVFFTIFLCICIGILLKKRMIRQLPGITMLALLLSAIGALNHRVITGVEVQSWHYQINVIPQATILAIALLIAELLPTSQTSGWRKPVQVISLMAYGGVGLIIASAFVNPGYVAAHVSADGILSPTSQILLNGMRIFGGISGALLVLFAFFRFRSRSERMYVRSGSLLYVLAFLPFVFCVGAVQYQLYYGYIKPNLGYNQQLAPALRWLDTHTEKESVVLCSLNYHTEHVVIPIYTHNNLYVAPLMSCYPVPSLLEIRDRIYNTLYIMGITTRQDFESYKLDKQIGGSFEEYQHKLARDLYTELKTYRVDYLFYGPREKASFLVDPAKTYPFLKEVYNDTVVKIYQIL